MFPIRDTVRSRTFPLVNSGLIAVNVLVYFIQLSRHEYLNQFIFLYGLVPARYTVPEIAAHFTFLEQAFPFLSFMFLHGGFWHILGNMWFLYIFGDNVEDHVGHSRYLAFYLLCGLVSGVTHLLFNLTSQVPTIGASGAVAGVMGAYFILYPRSRVLTFIPLLFIPYFFEIPAAFFLGLWFFFQFLSAAASGPGGGGIAWWAHVGGFIFGIVFLKLLDLFPKFGRISSLEQVTNRKTSPRIQVMKSIGEDGVRQLIGSLTITEQEAFRGTRKMISFAGGGGKKVFAVTVPPGTRDGTILRLPGIGRKEDTGEPLDGYVRIFVVTP